MSKTLLLADDSVVIQKLVALSFANEDVQLITVYNGDEAIEKARECHPDVVLADVVMPGKNGYEVCEAIRQDPQLSHVPVLLLTGTFEAFDEERAAQAGSNGHITKPFEAQALVERVGELLAAAPAPAPTAGAPAPAALDEAQSAYDFFDDDALATGASEVRDATPPLVPADDGIFAFADEAPSLGDPDAAPGLGHDLTEAVIAGSPFTSPLDLDDDPLAGMSDEGAAANALTITASGFQPALAASPTREESPLAATVVADFASDEIDPDLSAGAAESIGPEISDDLFETEPPPEGAATPDLEFNFDHEPSSPTSLPPEFDLSGPYSAGLAAPMPEAEIDPAGSSAYDVSISDLGDSFSIETTMAASIPISLDAIDSNDVSGADDSLEIGAPTGFAPELDETPFGQARPDASAARASDPLELTPFGDPFDVEFGTGPSSKSPPLEASSDDSPFEAALLAEAEPTDSPQPFLMDEEPIAPSPSPWANEPIDAAPWPVDAEPTTPPAFQTHDEPLAVPLAVPLIETPFEAATRPPKLAPVVTASEPDVETPFTTGESDAATSFTAGESDVETAFTAGESDAATAAGAHLSDVMRDRVQETLEKVAWEAFADLSDTIVRQVLERVERVAWEVIPQMAETLIREEIRKIKGGDDS